MNLKYNADVEWQYFASETLIISFKLKDVKAISGLVKQYADQGKMLYRRQIHVIKHIRDYFVVDINKKIIGCVALHLYNESLSEIKSLAIDKDFQKQGWGARLIEKCLEEISYIKKPRLNDYVETDVEARELAINFIKNRNGNNY